MNWRTIRFGLLLIFSMLGLTPSPAADSLKMIIPAYFYPLPGGSDWQRVFNGKPSASDVIFNPASGPGIARDSVLSGAAQQCRKAGIRLLGYIGTGYAAHPLQTMKAQIDAYRDLYGITDIFIDECSAKASGIPYYRELNRYVKAHTANALTVLNPGTVPDEGYMQAGDIICDFEDDLANYRKAQFPDWTRRYPGRFFHVVHGVPQAELPSVLRSAADHGAGYVYITDEGMKDPDPARPYGRLPSYYGLELNAPCDVRQSALTNPSMTALRL